MKIQIGLDEAGRGCVLGSLYIGAVVFESKSDDIYFKSLGVKDSKKLSPEKRRDLFSQIKKHCFYLSTSISTDEIDSNNLNDLEFNYMSSLASEIINRYSDVSIEKPDFEIYIDCPIKDTNKHSNEMFKSLPHHCKIKVISEHKADDTYIVVGASSIIAKVLRDREIEKMKMLYSKEYGDIGSGYPSDEKTRVFLENFYYRNGQFPIGTRMKWGTVIKIRRACSEDSEFDWEKLRDDVADCERNCKSI